MTYITPPGGPDRSQPSTSSQAGRLGKQKVEQQKEDPFAEFSRQALRQEQQEPSRPLTGRAKVERDPDILALNQKFEEWKITEDPRTLSALKDLAVHHSKNQRPSLALKQALLKIAQGLDTISSAEVKKAARVFYIALGLLNTPAEATVPKEASRFMKQEFERLGQLSKGEKEALRFIHLRYHTESDVNIKYLKAVGKKCIEMGSHDPALGQVGYEILGRAFELGQKQAQFTDLPVDILPLIARHLPEEDLASFGAVSRAFREAATEVRKELQEQELDCDHLKPSQIVQALIDRPDLKKITIRPELINDEVAKAIIKHSHLTQLHLAHTTWVDEIYRLYNGHEFLKALKRVESQEEQWIGVLEAKQRQWTDLHFSSDWLQHLRLYALPDQLRLRSLTCSASQLATNIISRDYPLDTYKLDLHNCEEIIIPWGIFPRLSSNTQILHLNNCAFCTMFYSRLTKPASFQYNPYIEELSLCGYGRLDDEYITMLKRQLPGLKKLITDEGVHTWD